MAVGRCSNQYSFASHPRGADNTATQTGFYIDIDGSGGSTIGALFASNTFARRTFTRPSAAAWHHYLFIFDLTKTSVQFDSPYVDGVQVSTSTNTENMAANQTFGNTRST